MVSGYIIVRNYVNTGDKVAGNIFAVRNMEVFLKKLATMKAGDKLNIKNLGMLQIERITKEDVVNKWTLKFDTTYYVTTDRVQSKIILGGNEVIL